MHPDFDINELLEEVQNDHRSRHQTRLAARKRLEDDLDNSTTFDYKQTKAVECMKTTTPLSFDIMYSTMDVSRNTARNNTMNNWRNLNNKTLDPMSTVRSGNTPSYSLPDNIEERMSNLRSKATPMMSSFAKTPNT